MVVEIGTAISGRRAAHQAPEFRVSQNQASPEGQILLTSWRDRATFGYLPYSTVLCHTLRMSCAQSKANIMGVRVPHQHIVLIKLVEAEGRRPSRTSSGRARGTRTSRGCTRWSPGRPPHASWRPSRRYVLRMHTVLRTYALVAGTTIVRETIIACDHRVR